MSRNETFIVSLLLFLQIFNRYEKMKYAGETKKKRVIKFAVRVLYYFSMRRQSLHGHVCKNCMVVQTTFFLIIKIIKALLFPRICKKLSCPVSKKEKRSKTYNKRRRVVRQ